MRISDWSSDVCSSDLALFLVDARAGLVPLDEEIARWLRGSTTPIVLVANKAEGRAGEAGVYEAMALGLGDPVQLSAEHGEGMGDLFEELLPHLDGKAIEAEDDDPENPAAPPQQNGKAACREREC